MASSSEPEGSGPDARHVSGAAHVRAAADASVQPPQLPGSALHQTAEAPAQSARPSADHQRDARAQRDRHEAASQTAPWLGEPPGRFEANRRSEFAQRARGSTQDPAVGIQVEPARASADRPPPSGAPMSTAAAAMHEVFASPARRAQPSTDAYSSEGRAAHQQASSQSAANSPGSRAFSTGLVGVEGRMRAGTGTGTGTGAGTGAGWGRRAPPSPEVHRALLDGSEQYARLEREASAREGEMRRQAGSMAMQMLQGQAGDPQSQQAAPRPAAGPGSAPSS